MDDQTLTTRTTAAIERISKFDPDLAERLVVALERLEQSFATWSKGRITLDACTDPPPTVDS